MLKLINNATQHFSKTAIISNGQSYSYHDLWAASRHFARHLLDNQEDLSEKRVAFMVTPSFDYVAVQWAIWQAGGVGVPLCTTHPLASLQYVIEDTAAEIIVVSPQYAALLEPLTNEKGIRIIVLEEKMWVNFQKMPNISDDDLPNIETHRRAMILYTSGTTNLPKGVVTTHANIEAQISMLVEAWKWRPTDHILCILPLHHVHGIINVISCALWSGAVCEFLREFSAEGVFNAFKRAKINVFMAVPTIYFKLIAYWESLAATDQMEISIIMKRFRLMVSGSAALPVSVMEKWEKISGHRLLERYGMTEIGMGISNPYNGIRRAGHIGIPLPGVDVRLVDDNNMVVNEGEAGEIQVRGANVFLEYWQRPGATAASFTEDGWFKTGDVAVTPKGINEGGYYKILGRNSVDIIKSGGYKISALEIEEVLRTHPLVEDCSVIGIENEEWGELVAAVLIAKDNAIDTVQINAWIRELMPSYKVPRHYKIVKELPRNAMGKVTKNDLKKLF